MSTPSTPSKATTTNERYLSRSYKQRYTRLGHTAAPTSVMRSPKYTKSPSTHTQLDSSPLFCKRILLQYDGSEKSDSEEDDPDSPSSRGRRSPFASRCASPFLGGWAPRELKEITSSQPILDDEGLFLASKNSATPIPTSSHPRTRPSSSGVRPAIPTFPCLSPLPIVRTQLPQTPAETEWHLGRQTESMTKLSLRDDLCPKRSKIRNKLSLGQFPSSPSPTNRYCGQKRSLDGEQIPRAMGGLFESWAETPTSTSFRLSGGELPAIDSPSLPAPAFNSLVSSSMCNSPMPPISLKLNMVDAQSPQPFSKSNVEPIAKKYRPRDSGIAGLEDSLDLTDKVEPCPLVDDDSIELVTPSLEPSTRSAWPTKPLDDSPGLEQLDDIIFKTLATGVTMNKDKRAVPGTPVKKISYAHSRPWMTVAQAAEVRGVGVPRKSLPLSFPSLAQLQNSPDASPSERSLTQRKPYGTLGQGRPNLMINKPNGIRMTLTRRSSSGAFSTSSSEGSFLGTPNKLNLLDKHPSTISRRPSPHPPIQFLNKVPNEFECPGKFERDFITLDTLGTGQFGSALKVKYKFGNEQDVFAIKKSKRLEGPKHRRRLREEVDVLRHLAALRGPDGHPNVLRYIDSWEQDDVLFIQTEICDLGDLAKFLAEYGTHFVALDEARIWKIAAELINGLKFIHDSGVVHLDIKPANIFITNQGRFKIGDFGMASLWPRHIDNDGFEREGDREYMAPEVLQGQYGPAADVFSLGMIVLEATANIVVPDMGNEWHMLRNDNFSAVDFAPSGFQPRSTQLIDFIMDAMRSKHTSRLTSRQVYDHPVITRARNAMSNKLTHAISYGLSVFSAGPLGGEPETFLTKTLCIEL